MCEQTDQVAVVVAVLFCFYFHFTKHSLQNGAVYKFHEGKSVLYLDGQGAYAETPAVSQQFPSFTITLWLKALSTGYVYSDWSKPKKFTLWIHKNYNRMAFQLKNNKLENLLSFYSG